MSLSRALHRRSYAILWAAQTVSSLGDWLYRIALVWWAMGETGSGAAVGAVAILTVIPQVLLLLIGGVIVDRMSRVRIMVISDVARCVLTALLATLVVTDHVEMWMVYAISFAFGVVDSFVGPAFNALIPEIVPAEDLPSANSLNALATQLCGIGGPALGAVLVASGGTALAFFLDALTFLFSAVALLVMGRPQQTATSSPTVDTSDDQVDDGLDGPMVTTVTIRATGTDILMMETKPDADGNVFRAMREGMKAVRVEPWLWVTLLCVTPALAVYQGLMSVSLPFMIKDTMQLDVGSLSIVQGAAALGAVIAAIVLGRRARLRMRGPVLYLCAVIMGACMVAMGRSTTVWGLACASLICNGALNVIYLVWVESLQATVPRDLLGRVASIDAVTYFALMPVGFAVAGWAADHAPPATSFVVGGPIVVGLAVLGFLHPRIRRFD